MFGFVQPCLRGVPSCFAPPIVKRFVWALNDPCSVDLRNQVRSLLQHAVRSTPILSLCTGTNGRMAASHRPHHPRGIEQHSLSPYHTPPPPQYLACPLFRMLHFRWHIRICLSNGSCPRHDLIHRKFSRFSRRGVVSYGLRRRSRNRHVVCFERSCIRRSCLFRFDARDNRGFPVVCV